MADLPPIAGWPSSVSPVGDPNKKKSRGRRRRHLRELKGLKKFEGK